MINDEEILNQSQSIRQSIDKLDQTSENFDVLTITKKIQL